MGQALYRKYRSKKLSEIVGQEHITDSLENALKTGRISHAYLFTGPRGVGKTSIARILAHEINGLPYDEASAAHMDIIEIDAASNRRIDEIRELRDKVAVAPTSAKYKVYIIDEVHMLTKEAFNALLKTLEEPPAHVVFILATTDAHKLPETIVSRTQRFTFKPVSQGQVVAHLREIADKEKIAVSDEALELLADHGEGSFRDSISLLDQASNHGAKLERSDVEILLGIPSVAGIQQLVDSLATGSSQATAVQLNSLYEQGFQAAAIAKSVSKLLREALIAGQSRLEVPVVLDLLARLLEVPASHDPERFLEIILLGSVTGSAVLSSGGATTTVSGQVPKPAAAPSPPPLAPAPKAPPPPVAIKPEPKVEPEVAAVVPEPATAPEPVGSFNANLWPAILSALKKQYNTLYGVVRMAEPEFKDRELELAFGFAFHQKRLSEPKNKKILGDIIQELSGQAVQVTCIVRKDAVAKPAIVAAVGASEPADLSAISDIFGGGELV
ncbi:MAG: polymerase subunit gamma/tau [Candidatus Saccharibacteria bacterium]|nr:polymerase subunit gamma/tau [Candidatus Saccharibacteria bacterium]